MESLIYFYVLTNPQTSAAKIYAFWEKSKIFREYEKPEKTQLQEFVLAVKQDLISKGIRVKLN